ncbi:class II receptor tyrosine kinase-like isoform X2 [Corticium candelabrum]|uniref:class II receptor tyrosine kinase-like isoform X2 n=1 Tax=Corticium candelabrum TaxID=121492 RepID=UPI002E255555|nr:class II receptor tyrosine kinase-like isoform X2 [Corticium candelabrum]
MQCQAGWIRSGLSCYRLVSTSKIWEKAETDCITREGHLASIASVTEDSVVLSLRGTSSSDRNDTWIGLHDQVVENTFVWSDGTSSTYTNWDTAGNEPSGSGDCVRIRSDGKWKYQNCTASYPYVCEYNLTRSTTQTPTTLSATTSLCTPADAVNTKSRSAITVAPSPSTAIFATSPTTASATTDSCTSRIPTTSSQITTQYISRTVSPTATLSTTAKASTQSIFTHETKANSSNTSVYAGIAAAIAIIVLMASVIFAFLFCKRNKPKSNLLQAHSSENLNSNGVGPNFAKAGAYFNKRGSAANVSLYCEPTTCTSMMNNPLRELAQSTSAVAQGGSTTSSHSTRQGSRKDVDVYCEPITATISQPTDELIEVSEDENYYLRFTPLENLTNTKQSCKQQTKNSVAKKTATEDEYVRARLISDNPLTKVDVKMAEVVTNVVDAENAETSYELVVKPTKKGNMKGYRNMAYEKDALDATSNGQDVDKSTSAIRSDDDKFWEPATTEQELYGQLEGKRFRRIDRRDVRNRQKIGSGAFGVVEKAIWRANDRENIPVAVKTLTNETNASDRVKFLREAAITGQFRHSNVVRLYGVVTLGSPIMLVLEYLQNSDLKMYLEKRKLDGQCCRSGFEKTLLKMCRDIANGMEYLSRKSFVHRDVAARNILLSKDLTCKIADFGLARELSDDTYYTITGGKLPIKWCAPEIWNYKKYSSASDVWSYGVVLYEVWSIGRRPFGLMRNNEVMKKVETGYRLPPPPGCSRSLYHLMIDCWHSDSHKRPKFGNIVKRLGVSDELLLINKKETSIKGNLGDALHVSDNCYTDLQHIYMQNADHQTSHIY